MIDTQERLIIELNGFLQALKSYSNYTYEFYKCDEEEILFLNNSSLVEIDLAIISDGFKMWLMNSLHEWVSEEFHYVPVLNDIGFWEKKAGFAIKEKIIGLQWEAFLDTLLVDIFGQKPYRCFKGLYSRAVISESYLFLVDKVYYVLSFGWDD